jgi:uncharacterized small protein (TIGR04563 family)
MAEFGHLLEELQREDAEQRATANQVPSGLMTIRPPPPPPPKPLKGEGSVKLSAYVPLAVLREIDREAMRQQRGLSWIVRRAWALAREEIQRESDRFEAGERRAQE